MTGAEHYTEAERLLSGYAARAEQNRPYAPGLLLEAQAHATLALAAATAMQGGAVPRTRAAWLAVAAEQETIS